MKIRKITIILAIVVFAICTMGQNATNATATQVSIDAKISSKRYLNGAPTKAYKVNKGNDHNLFKILSVKNNNEIDKTNFYCLNQSIGATWYNNASSEKVTYDAAYDMVTQKDEIKNLPTSEYKAVATNTNYGKLLWVLDHMYVGQNGISKTELLKKAGIVWGETDYYPDINCWHYDSSTQVWLYGFEGYYVMYNGNQKDVILSEDEVEAIQQAVIWHYTNSSNSEFDLYTTDKMNSPGSWFEYTENETGDSTTDEQIKKFKQEQAAILYNYFIDGAEAAGNSYTSTSEGTVTIKYTDSSKKIEKDGNNYKIGPLKIEKTGNTTLTGLKITTGTNNTDITSSATVSGTSKTSPEANKEFYVTVPTSSVTGDIKVTVNGKYSTIKKTLLLKTVANSASAEQPLVQYEPKTENISHSITASPEKIFDLALRKIITKIDGKTALLNEDGKSATRNITVDKTTIPDTATYKHRKDPVVVSEGSIVTYQIHIYNEGDVDGYATHIVDQLPKGLQSTLSQGTEITSLTNKNKYTVNYSTTTNKIELVLNDKVKAIKAYDGSTLSSDIIELTCKVTSDAISATSGKNYLTNIAYISEAEDSKGTVIQQDRNNTESKPGENPVTKNSLDADKLNSSDANSYKGATSNQTVYGDTNNNYYYKGQEDDDDFEKIVVIPQFDLALRKFITKINSTDITDREPVITQSELDKLANSNATYDNGTTTEKTHSKDKLTASKGDEVVYTIRVYNEGQVNAKGIVVTDYLPEGLELIPQAESTINTTYGWSKKGDAIVSTYLKNTVLEAFNKETKKLNYLDLKVHCRVSEKATSNNLKNIAEITEATDEDGNKVTDIDSKLDNVNTGDSYNPEAPEKGKGEQDDDDFEDLELGVIDLALRKFIAKTSPDGTFPEEDNNIFNREPQVDTSKLKSGKATTATYKHNKEPLEAQVGDYILYTIRLYNEGNVDAYASQVTDYLPEYLEFVEATDSKVKNINDNWTYDSKTRKATTNAEAPNANTKIKAFDSKNDDGKGSGLSYLDLQIVCKINKNATSNKKITNIAEITEYKNKDGKVIKEDIDSESNNIDYPENPSNYKDSEIEEGKEYIPGQEDDDDFEKIIIKKFDLALRKFITDISGKKVTSRIPKVEYKDKKITYTHPKDVLKVTVDDIVTYTLRVFNEGEVNGYAEKVSDDIPTYLEFLPNNNTNKKYGWKMYDKNGKEATSVKDAVKIETEYLSKAAGEERNEDTLLKAFDKDASVSEKNPDYLDVQVAFKVKDPNSNKTVITNKAQISEDADENGNPVDDIDSVPDKWNDGEDDQDYENVSVEYFDLSLLKYVTKAIVTENGKTKTIKTGNTGAKTDIIPKVEIYRKSVYKTTVKFEYTIKVTNEGDIEGYATELTDYVPKGLKFYSEDNKDWKDEGNNVISTTQLKDTLLKPGQSATVKVILRWINGENNLSLKTNIAEISKDKNERGVPDRDSTPDNKKDGEDDIDDASVLLTISTGSLENTIAYVGGALVVLIVLGLGITIIKRYVY